MREGRRIKAALKMGRLLSIKTLTGFDFSFQPSLDRDRIMALPAAGAVIHSGTWVTVPSGCSTTSTMIPRKR